MAYISFYIYLILTLIALFVCNFFRRIKLVHILIGITSIAYSIIVDVIFGNWLGYYLYLDYANSTLYMVLAGVFIYPVLNIIYVLFLPEKGIKFITYTAFWIIALIVFEYLSLIQNIIIFTGWKPIPWSLALYAFTYLWIIMFFRYLKKEQLNTI